MRMMTFIWSILFLTMPFYAGAWAAGAGPDMTADQALANLQQGNLRFVAGKQEHPRQDFTRRDITATKGQHPFATILSCSDSRVPPEVLFDQGVGDIFVVRVAGNVANVDEAGSIEYAVDHLGTSLLVVLGHTNCGAVTAAVQGAEVHGNVTALIKSIIPAVVRAKTKDPEASGETLLNECIKSNVWQAIEDLFRTSAIVTAKAKDGKIKVVGAVYDVATGRVNWLGPYADQDKLTAAYPWGKSGAH